jgi:hypothetical protein
VYRIFLLVFVSSAAEVHIRFSALERMLSQQMFTEDGRKYVKGDKNAKCSYAWLEKPRVSGESGRLLIRARFTGRSALDVFGRCIGMGDSFDLKIRALPYFKDGQIALRDVEASPESSGGFYATAVCATLASRALEDPGTQPGYPRELRRFSVPRMYVTQDALAVVLDFDVVVK